MAPSSDPQAFRDALAMSKRVVILAGAGLSAASGIPTYRDPDGLWKMHSIKELATPEGFQADPSQVWQFYRHRRELCLRAQPNAAHRALASLGLPSVRAQLLPALADPARPPLFITQNIDGLSPRALAALSSQLSPAALKLAEERLIEMHGSIHTARCLQCKAVTPTPESYPGLSAAASDSESDAPEALSAARAEPVGVEALPRCGGAWWNGSNRYGRCGGLLRPAVVWFGEAPEGMGEIAKELNWTDLLIVVGTSSVVRPAAGYAEMVKKRGGRVAVFNLGRSEGDEEADFLFLGPCEQTLPAILETVP
ncbi:hypothetical protein FOMPIDRAFT_1030221 [Fomitopsis schrenkii]|uniref:Deacetylase sirtuin-type domain-containing protein n=1 Tax=Fomitopsis schrenkii TaxID=2126942 RepID=S8E700_FOMSC|nr:hypothetical protein FOMPIDRAFT_1030221 [Fomitopsis schrenkii]